MGAMFFVPHNPTNSIAPKGRSYKYRDVPISMAA